MCVVPRPDTLHIRHPPFRGGWGASVARRRWCDIYGVVFLYLDRDPWIRSLRQRKHGPRIVHWLGPVKLAGGLAEQLQAATLLSNRTERQAHIAIGHRRLADHVGPHHQRFDLLQQAVSLDNLLGLLRPGQGLWQVGDLVPVQGRRREPVPSGDAAQGFASYQRGVDALPVSVLADRTPGCHV